VGTVEAGKLADIVVAGDPLRDVAVLQPAENVRLVMKGGQMALNRGLGAVAGPKT
jgi:imidazolonepropionase-like amidohydrolase